MVVEAATVSPTPAPVTEPASPTPTAEGTASGSPSQRDAVAIDSRATVDLGLGSTDDGGRSSGYLGFGAAFVMITVLSAALLWVRSG